MTNKVVARNRRAKKLRSKSIDLSSNRLSVFRSSQHIYAQIFSTDGSEIIAQASTLDKELKLKSGSNSDAAEKVGTSIAEKGLSIGIKKVAFDRSGYKYHGRVKALADGIREKGIKF